MIPDPGLLQPILQPWINILVDRLTGRQVRQLDNRQTFRHVDRQTGRQEDRQTGRQADRQTGRQVDRQTVKYTWQEADGFGCKLRQAGVEQLLN